MLNDDTYMQLELLNLGNKNVLLSTVVWHSEDSDKNTERVCVFSTSLRAYKKHKPTNITSKLRFFENLWINILLVFLHYNSFKINQLFWANRHCLLIYRTF